MVRWLHFLTPVTYFSKLLGMSKFAAFPKSEIFWMNGTEWRNYIHFRDCLNANENMALQYQRVKEELESKYADNRGLYTKGKKEIIDIILNN